jgi:hypothetical protein
MARKTKKRKKLNMARKNIQKNISDPLPEADLSFEISDKKLEDVIFSFMDSIENGKEGEDWGLI